MSSEALVQSVPAQPNGNPPVPLRRRETDDPQRALGRLQQLVGEHGFWKNRLFRACQAGHLVLEDYRFIFGQYYFYNRNFTRYLSALMTNCDNDLYRSRLSENLWEEGGALAPEKRHAEIFRKFMREGLQIQVETLQPLEFSWLFSREYLDFCVRSHPMAASAFLSLGTEAIVSRMYQIFVEGLRQAGIPDEQLEFFHIHIGCDDEHAETLAQMMLSYFEEPDWFNTCRKAMDHALNLRWRFFENLYDAIQERRVHPVVERIQARRSLLDDAGSLHHRPGEAGIPLYRNTHEGLGIDFEVERVPFQPEVLDPRLVHIAPGKRNEHHKHAHETVFYIVAGEGKIIVDAREIPVKAGDLVFVPRWAMHQSCNEGTTELLILAVTDYGLTRRAYIGDYLKTARMQQAADGDARGE